MPAPAGPAPRGATPTPLADAPLHILGRLTTASNATFLCRLEAPGPEMRCVYKPVLGERPLWDFPDGTLAAREYASYLISEELGWGIVPRTLLRDGPHGTGMVQEWIDTPPADGDAADLVDLFPVEAVPDDYLAILEAEDPAGRRVVLAHADDPRLERIAALDAVLNNPDRKGGHVLRGPGGRVHGVDHGICLHSEPKLRTVLWGWAHRPVPRALLEGIAALGAVLADPSSSLSEELDGLLTVHEVRALTERIAALLATGRHPGPAGARAIPWPPF